MSILNIYVLNRAYLKGYNTEKVIECYREYLKGKKGIDLPKSHHKGRMPSKDASGKKIRISKKYDKHITTFYIN